MRIFVLIATLLTLGAPAMAGENPLTVCGHPAGCHER